MIIEFLFIYMLLLSCIGGLYIAVKRNWWPLLVISSMLLFPLGNGFLDIVGRMLGFVVS